MFSTALKSPTADNDSYVHKAKGTKTDLILQALINLKGLKPYNICSPVTTGFNWKSITERNLHNPRYLEINLLLNPQRIKTKTVLLQNLWDEVNVVLREKFRK